MKPIHHLLALVLSLAPALSLAVDRFDGSPYSTRSQVYASKGMAATSHPLATQIALDVLKAGGSAVDAAIAANAALGLMEPTGCGIGGDLFAIVWDPKSQKLHAYNGAGRSPLALKLQHFKDRQLSAIPSYGPLPVTVPGAVDGWFALHERFGRRPMADLLAPTIRYAQEGHPVAPYIASLWARSATRFAGYAHFRETFTTDGKAPAAGEVWKNPDLARTLQKIAREGRSGFYRGEVPATIERFFKAQGGFLAAADFEAHRGQWVEPVSTNYRGYDVWEIPPESASRVGHPAPFPVALPERLIHMNTYEGELVLDPFMGSGTTAVAAKRTGRHFVGYDTDAGYAAAALARVADTEVVPQVRVRAGEGRVTDPVEGRVASVVGAGVVDHNAAVDEIGQRGDDARDAHAGVERGHHHRDALAVKHRRERYREARPPRKHAPCDFRGW